MELVNIDGHALFDWHFIRLQNVILKF